MRFEKPNLPIPFRKTFPVEWMWKVSGCDENSAVASMAMKDAALFAPPAAADLTSWMYLEAGEASFSLPTAYYDAVFIMYALEHYSTEKRRDLILECGSLVKPGGKVVAVSLACDDGQEILDLMEPTGVDVSTFVEARLNNADISRLRPSDAVFLKGMDVIPTRKRLVKYIRSFNIECELNHLWKAGNSYAVNRLSVGMIWQAM